MAKRDTRRLSASSPTRGSAERIGNPFYWETVPLAGLVALLVATPLVPSEGTAELGVSATWIMVALIVCVGWLLAVLIRGQTNVRLGGIDAAAALLLALTVLSALIMSSQGCPRATINTAWQWVGFGAIFFLGRQLLREAAAVRAASAVMIGLAVCLSALAYYQYFYSLPAEREKFALDPEAMLRDAGFDPTPGTPERKLFEDRLQSTEPMATFALANSLAGFLAPWLIVTLGIAVGVYGSRKTGEMVAGTDRRDRSLSPFWPGLAAAFIGFCLLLTKSRTALLAVALGVSLLAASRWPIRRLFSWRVLVIAVAVGGLLGGVLALGAWDRLVLTETPKSLLYRFQYWQATAAMIADHPWFGCGPGNFQHYYTMYKLPEASESIADPHNLLFEVAATAGLPALAAFAAVLALAAGRWLVTFRREARSCGADSVDSQMRNGPSDRQNPRPVPANKTAQTIASGLYVGALIGVGLAWWTGFVFDMQPDVALLVLGVPAAVLLLAAVHPWTARGRIPEATPWIAFVVLTINLLAAGGIGFAGIAPSWWMLLAVAINSTETVSSERRVPRIAVGLLAAGALVLIAACFVTLYTPVLRCRAKLDEGLALARLSRFAEAESVFREAAGADPYSAEPWQELTILYHQAALETGSEEALRRFEAALGETLQRNPHAHTLRRLVGDWHLAIFARWADRRNLEEAIDAYSRSVQLYPNHAYGHAQLAWAYHLGGDYQSASREATEALRLDALNPHREKKLSQQRLYDPGGKAAEPRENAEQMMRRLRK